MCIYGMFIFSSFLSPPIINKIGNQYNKIIYRWSLVLSSLGYVLFISSNIYPIVPVSIVSAIIIGLSAGLAWNCQGNYLADTAILHSIESHKCMNIIYLAIQAITSKFNGLFYLHIKFSNALGNIIFSALLTFLTIQNLFIISAVLCLVATLTFSLLPKIESIQQVDEKPLSLKDIYRLITKTKAMKWLILASFHVGLSYININNLVMVFVLLILQNMLLKKH